MNPSNMHGLTVAAAATAAAAAAAAAAVEDPTATTPSLASGHKRTSDGFDVSDREHAGAGAGALKRPRKVRVADGDSGAAGAAGAAAGDDGGTDDLVVHVAAMQLSRRAMSILNAPIMMANVCAFVGTIVGLVGFYVNSNMFTPSWRYPIKVALAAVRPLLCARGGGEVTRADMFVTNAAAAQARTAATDPFDGNQSDFDTIDGAARMCAAISLSSYRQAVAARTPKQRREDLARAAVVDRVAHDRATVDRCNSYNYDASLPVEISTTPVRSFSWTHSEKHEEQLRWSKKHVERLRRGAAQFHPVLGTPASPLNMFIVMHAVQYAIWRAEHAPVNLGFRFTESSGGTLVRTRVAMPVDAIHGGIAPTCVSPLCMRNAALRVYGNQLCVKCTRDVARTYHHVREIDALRASSMDEINCISKRVFSAYYNMFIASSLERRRLHMRFIVGEFTGNDGVALPRDVCDLILAHARE